MIKTGRVTLDGRTPSVLGGGRRAIAVDADGEPVGAGEALEGSLTKLAGELGGAGGTDRDERRTIPPEQQL